MGKPFAQDLSTPLGKMLRVNKQTGAAAPDNPFVDQPDADPRIFAYGFSRPFNFAFHPQSGQIYGTDNTASCEELNLIQPGGNYGWPDVGEFPWPDCTAGEQIEGIHFFTLEGKKPGDFLSVVGVTALQFASGDVYPLMGDSLLVCESETNYMRRLLLSGTDLDQVTDDDVVVKDCDMDIAISPDGIVYYSNEGEIRRLVPISE
jgi:glucose/arabinose dehydrogenase